MADKAHKITDKMLAKMEGIIEYDYENTIKELEKKILAYTKQFQAEDKKKQALVNKGLMSQEAFNKWRMGKMAMGSHWRNLKGILSQDMANRGAMVRRAIGEHMMDVYALNSNYMA